MRRPLPSLTSIAMLAMAQPLYAEEPVAASSLQEQINHKYRNYFGADSQTLLPFTKVEIQDWKNIRANKTLKRIYVEPDKYYNSKVYTFTLYQATDDGRYYLDAKGGFWGMDELIYGPINEKEFGGS